MKKKAYNFYDAGTIAFYDTVLNYLYSGLGVKNWDFGTPSFACINGIVKILNNKLNIKNGEIDLFIVRTSDLNWLTLRNFDSIPVSIH